MLHGLRTLPVLAVVLSACSGTDTIPQPPTSQSGAPAPLTGDPSVAIFRVSDESPYAPGFCQSDPKSHGYEADPAFTIGPHGLIAAWEQDGSNTTPGAVVGYSLDDGRTWTQTVPASPAKCLSIPGGIIGPGIFEPGLATDGLGTTFLLVANDAPAPMSVSTSRDDGATWSQPMGLPQLGDGLLDAVLGSGPTISADPSNPAAVSVTIVSHQPPDSVWFARTDDDGATWSTLRPVRLAPPGMIVVGANIVTLPSGTLLIMATDFSALDIPPPGENVAGLPHDVAAVRSTDHGATWSETTVASLSAKGFGIYRPAIGSDGSVYELISDGSGAAQVWTIFRSSDDGVSWSKAAHVPLPPRALPSEGETTGGAFISNLGLAIAADGTNAILYDAVDSNGKTTNVLLTYSHDGGQTWHDLHLGGPFDLSALPAGLGDYQVLSTVDGEIAALFLLGPCSAKPSDRCPATTAGPTDLYFARISF